MHGYASCAVLGYSSMVCPVLVCIALCRATLCHAVLYVLFCPVQRFGLLSWLEPHATCSALLACKFETVHQLP